MLEPDKKKLARATAAALSALQEAGARGLTTMQGVEKAGLRFPARCHELRQLGHIIKAERVPGDRILWKYTWLGFQASPQLLLFKAA